MITSVASGRCGPCASRAPSGRIATARSRSIPPTSCQVSCARSRTGTVDRNPQFSADAIAYFYAYPRASVVVAHRETAAPFLAAAAQAPQVKRVIVVGEPETADRLSRADPQLTPFPTHRDDAAMWLFSGGTT